MVTRHRALARLLAFIFILTLVSVPSSFQTASAKPHKVTYALGGGTGTLPTEANHNSGDTFIVASSTGITRAGYAFNNWFDGTTGYAPGSTYTMPNVDVTLTATWTPTHSVTYALGGGTGTVPTQGVVAEGSTFVVGSSSGISRSGYTFNNWSNGISGFAPGAIYTMGTSNVTLTATWTPITHSVTYSLGGGTGTLPTQGAVAEGATFTVASSSGITRTGYTFNNWSDGTSGYAPGATYTMGTSNVTLTATWTAITHTVTYALGGGTGTLPSQTPVAEGATFTVASSSGITRTGYTFNNWSGGTTEFAPGAIYTMGTSNVTLTATWTAITRSVTYALGGGTGTVPTQAPVAEGSSFVVASSSGITRAGYTFNNWSDGTTGYAPGVTYTVGASNVTLTATWTAITHSVTYALGGGTGTVPTQGDVAEGSSFTVASSSGISRSGFTFNNWSDGTTGYAPGASYTMGTSNVTLTATWTAITRSVTYALGGGTGTVPTQAPVAEGSSFTVASSSGITRSGYTFNNWSDGTNGYVPGASYTVGASNVTLTATWTAITHSVTYALGGGTGTLPTQSAVTEGSSFVVASSSGISRAGYTFNNWSDGSTGYAPGATYTMGTSNVTLTATWILISVTTHTVTYALGGGTGTVPTQADVAEGATFSVASSSGITRAGYKFNNWSDGTTGYAAGATYTMGTSNVTLTATWILISVTTHTVTYALGGGLGTVPTQADVAEGSTFVVASASGISRVGYTFNNWSDGTTGYAPGATYTMGTSNVTLTATWTALTRSVTYALGGGAGTVPTQAPVAEGTSFIVASSLGITRTGYTFNNWSDGTTGYAPGASYIAESSNITMTATWTAVTRSVTYALGGGTGTVPTQTAVAEGSTFVVASASGITRSGYNFNNWSDGVTGYAPGASYTVGSSNITLTATWSVVTRSVTYALGGGTGTVPTQAPVADGSTFVVGSSSAITSSGFSFDNWFDGTTGYAPGATYTVGSSNITLTATWLALPTHVLSFNANGGVGTMADEISNGPRVISENTFTRPGFTFVGWMSTPTGGIHFEIGDIYSFTSDKTLYAEWSLIPTTTGGGGGGGATAAPGATAPIIHQVTFDGNGATSGSMSVQGATFPSDLSPNLFTRAGFNFEHWSTNPEADGTIYGDEDTYSFTADVTLYAHWGIKAFNTVTFVSNGASPDGSISQEANQPTVLAANRFVRKGYSFTGWATVANGSGLSFADGATYEFDRDVILFAQWEPIVIAPIIVSPEAPLILPILANEAKTVVVGVLNGGVVIPLTLDIPVGITGFDGTIRLIPVLVTDLDPQGLISIKIEILDSFGAVIPQINALLTIRFSNAAGETVVASSPDGFIWTPIPLMESGRTTLNPGERDGYYLDSNGKVVVVTSHLTFFGFKKPQTTKLALNISAPKPIKGYLARVSSIGGSGVGFVRFLSLTTPVCSVSESGELIFNSTGPCKITAVKGGDKTHLHQDAPVYQLNIRENTVNVLGSGTTKKVVVTLGYKYAYKEAVIEYSASGTNKYVLLSSARLSKSGQVTISKKLPTGSMLRVIVAGKVVASTLVNGKN